MPSPNVSVSLPPAVVEIVPEVRQTIAIIVCIGVERARTGEGNRPGCLVIDIPASCTVPPSPTVIVPPLSSVLPVPLSVASSPAKSFRRLHCRSSQPQAWRRPSEIVPLFFNSPEPAVVLTVTCVFAARLTPFWLQKHCPMRQSSTEWHYRNPVFHRPRQLLLRR